MGIRRTFLIIILSSAVTLLTLVIFATIFKTEIIGFLTSQTEQSVATNVSEVVLNKAEPVADMVEQVNPAVVSVVVSKDIRSLN